MNSSIGDAAIQGINALIDTVKSIAPGMWEIYTKQQVITGYANIIIGVLMLLTVFGLLKFVKWVKAKDNESEYLDGDRGDKNPNYWTLYQRQRVIQIGFITIGILSLIGLFLVVGGVLQILNPEYYAIKELLSMIP